MRRIAVTTLLTAILLLFSIQAGADNTARPSGDQAPVKTLAERLSNSPTQKETDRIQSVLNELTAGNSSDIPVRISNEEILFISPREVYLRALKKNLSIQISIKNSAIAEAAIQEAEAVFDPVLSLRFSYSRSDTYERTKEIYLQTKDFSPPPTTDIPTDPNNTGAQVNQIGWKRQEEGVRSIETVYASEDQENGPTTAFDYNLGISQKLPWGPELDLGLTMHDEKVYYDSHGHSYDRPWASTFVADLTTPLPFTMDFGPDSPDALSVKQKIKSSEQSRFTTSTAINNILYQADLAYWNVVRRFENLGVMIRRRKLLEYQLESVNRRFKNREATNYDRLQVESALTLSKVLETSAATALLDASYTLASLLEDKPAKQSRRLYVPYKYLEQLESTEYPDMKEALARALVERPELKAGAIGIEIAEINQTGKANQLRPDLKFYGSYSSSQDGSVYGYKNPLKSLTNMNNPDDESLFTSIEYQYPILNRYLDARFEQARLGTKQAALSQRITKNSVIREVRNTTTRVNTSISRIEAARESERFAALAFDKVKARQQYGEASEFEVLLALQRLSEAQLSLILARIDHRTALTGLSAAIGDLAATSADRALSRKMDRHRLAVMRHYNILPHFSRHNQTQESAQ
ncbi:TolC family protein [Maridesulfovibrio sp.]|uniref:TolC family protein n=1 Tax=Maridesulfovibrio sp. TaxID=2795000 RepID=UPI002A188D5D|nr:TolC family protein [Maridesulfovibrio sp.]